MSNALATAAIFFPLWLGIWQQRPITSEDLKYEQPVVMQDSVLQFLNANIASCNAPLRAQIYCNLASAPIPANRDFLLSCLRREQDSRMRTTLLTFLKRMDTDTMPPDAIEPYLTDSAPLVSLAAVKLYALLPNAKTSALIPFLQSNTPHSAIRNAAWHAFAHSPRLAAALGRDVLNFRQDEEPDIRAAALSTALAQPKRVPETTEWLRQAATDGSRLMRLAAAADPTPDPDILRKLLRDPDPSVRLTACTSGNGRFRDIIADAVDDSDQSVRTAALHALTLSREPASRALLQRIADHLGDPSPLTALQAERSFTLLAANAASATDAEDILRPLVAEPSARLHAVQAAEHIKLRSLARDIAAVADTEKRPECLAAEINALAVLAPKGSYADILLPNAAHSSPVVRQAVAKALGTLAIPDTEHVISKLALDPKSSHVRAEAFTSMGRFPRQVFIKDILKCLTDTIRTTSTERANAAWAVAQIPVTQQCMDEFVNIALRLRTQTTVAVIPTNGGPVFEDEAVLANCFFAIAKLAKNTPDKQDFADAASIVFGLYSLRPDNAPNNDPKSIPRTYITHSLVTQATLWLDGENITTQPTNPKEILLPLEQLQSTD